MPQWKKIPHGATKAQQDQKNPKNQNPLKRKKRSMELRTINNGCKTKLTFQLFLNVRK